MSMTSMMTMRGGAFSYGHNQHLKAIKLINYVPLIVWNLHEVLNEKNDDDDNYDADVIHSFIHPLTHPFSAVTLLVRQHEGLPACKESRFTYPQTALWRALGDLAWQGVISRESTLVNITWYVRLCDTASDKHISWLSNLTTTFPGEPGLAGFIEAKDDGSCGDNWIHKICNAPVKSLSPTNQHPAFYKPGALPVTKPKVSEH